jgi:O-methyltransferase
VLCLPVGHVLPTQLEAILERPVVIAQGCYRGGADTASRLSSTAVNVHDAKVALDHASIAARYPREYALFRKYRDRSMVPRRKFVDNLRLARSVIVDGPVVECGSWHGGMSAAISEVLPGREFFLLDSFEGLPDAGAHDTERDRALVASDRLVGAEATAIDTMRRGSGEFKTVRGWFDVTVPSLGVERIALLRLDGDLYDSTLVCLNHLFPLVVPGGLVIIDDYGEWDGCTRAVHDYLSGEQRNETIERTRYGVTYMCL